MARQMGITIGWMAAIYFAVVLQTGHVDPRGAPPVWTAIVAAWAVTSQSAVRSVVWAALAGLACDAAGHGQLGLHMATYSVLAALASSWWSNARPHPASMTIAISALISGGDEFVTRALASMTNSDAHPVMHVAIAAVQTAVVTAAAVLTVLVAGWMARRLLLSDGAASPLRLKNRWSMLTE